MIGGLAACGSSSTDTSGSTPASGQGSSAATAPTITLAVMAEFTGANSSSVKGIKEIATTWEKWVNDTGGIQGHPVKIEFGDSGGEPAKGTSVVKGLVENKHVVALVGDHDTSAESYYADYLKAKGVPVIGGSGYTPPFWHNSDFFPLGADAITTAYLTPELISMAGGKKWANVVCAEVASCAQSSDIIKPLLSAKGIEFGGTIKVAASSPDFTAECLKMKQDGDDVVTLAANAAVVRKLIQDCQAQGYSPTYQTNVSSYSTDLTKISGAKFIADIHGFPWWTDDPQIKQFRDVVSKYGNTDDLYDASNTATWAALQYFRTAVEAAHITGEVTAPDVVKGIYSLKDVDLGGLLAQKFTFSPTDTERIPNCAFVAGVEDGKLTAPQGLKPICATIPTGKF
ncbi:MAG TPA: ABC transporter substrate-binding protein [Mycobacteriales bacterium]|nr:ABC transporter substrate-binding protein [Mycobacteriales bacterium]